MFYSAVIQLLTRVHNHHIVGPQSFLFPLPLSYLFLKENYGFFFFPYRIITGAGCQDSKIHCSLWPVFSYFFFFLSYLVGQKSREERGRGRHLPCVGSCSWYYMPLTGAPSPLKCESLCYVCIVWWAPVNLVWCEGYVVRDLTEKTCKPRSLKNV